MKEFLKRYNLFFLFFLAFGFSIISSTYFFITNSILLYGDAESHLNIAKRVIDSLTPGFAQLGGIWLPLPHLLLLPFVAFDPLWKTGIAGSIVGGISYIISAVFIYKLLYLLLKNTFAAYVGFFVFALNPNILYMQSTPLGELTLIAFFILSVYFLLAYLQKPSSIPPLVMSAFFGFCASLTRYDGWFLVLFEVLVLMLFYLFKRKIYIESEGIVVLFSTLAFFGIALWFLWDGLILHDPLYFTNSPFSAKSQQQGWMARGQLVTYKNMPLSFLYYADATARNVGLLLTAFMFLGCIFYLLDKQRPLRLFVFLLLSFPFVFYVLTLYLGQSIILLPDLTPASFSWKLFNARYGIIMLPFAAVFIGFLAYRANLIFRVVLISALVFQLLSFGIRLEPIITLEDGKTGLSAMKQPNAQIWMAHHYNNGLVLLDDYARTISIIKSNISLHNVIYVGNHPYWDNALKDPEKYATWIVIQRNDTIWTALYKPVNKRNNLYKYYSKVYTSPEVLIFKRNNIPT